MADLKWVAERCESVLLPALREARTEEEVKMVCQNEVAFWQEKFPGVPNSWRKPHTQSRAIAAASDLSAQKKAWVHEYLSLGKEKWMEINEPAAPKIAERLEHQLLLKDPDRIIDQATALLQSPRWADVAAGLALATGRRIAEVLKTAEFQAKTAYTVIFTGQLKNRDVGAYEIPTLCPAALVLDAWQRLRAALDVEDLSEGEVSNNYRKPVTASVKKHFEHMVPAHEEETISVHDLRAVYLRLAIFCYAPVQVDEATYAAEIAGHRVRGGGARSYGADANYRDYKVADAAGNIDGRQGVKLGQEGVVVLDAFAKSQGGSTVSRTPKNALPVNVENGRLTPEMLVSGELLALVHEGMAAANVTDFHSYVLTALKRQARADLGMARHDTVADVESMSLEDLTKSRKKSTAQERIRRAIAAIAQHNDTCGPLERWYITATVISDLIGGRFQTILDYLNEHQAEIEAINAKYKLDKKHNRKPVKIGEMIRVE
jgi:hypothetical protein